MKERPGKTARRKSQLFIWVGINQLGAALSCSFGWTLFPGRPGWGLLSSKGWQKNTRGLLEAEQGRHYCAAPVRAAHRCIRSRYVREPQRDLVGTAAIIWLLLMKPTCGPTAHGAAQPQHWRSSGPRELQRSRPLTSSGADLIHKSNH